MHNCSNYTEISPKLAKCHVLNEFGIDYIPSEKRRGCPCNQCKKEWTETPTKDTLTPTMNLIIRANGKIELPTIAERASSFVNSLKEWVFSGFKNVPENEYKHRLSICESNKCGMFDAEKRICNACGCKTDVKCLWSGETCPANLWPEIGPEYKNQPNPGKCGSCGK